VFLGKAYSPAVGFLFGWSLFLIIQTGTIAAVAVAFANFSGVLVSGVAADNYLITPRRLGGYAIGLSTQQLVAILMILLLTGINTRGLKVGKVIQNTFTVTKTAALFGLIVVGLAIGWNHGSAAYTSSWWHPGANGWNPQIVQPGLAAVGALALVMLLGRAMTGPLFAQSAWNNVTFTAGEVENRAQFAARFADWLRDCSHALSIGESRIRSDPAIGRHSRCSSGPRGHRDHASDLRLARNDLDGRGDHGVDLWL
jgi:APA family basic amino acid/polyamine antiporter